MDIENNKTFGIILLVVYLTAMIVYGSIIIRDWHVVDDWLKGFFFVSFVIFAVFGVSHYYLRMEKRKRKQHE